METVKKLWKKIVAVITAFILVIVGIVAVPLVFPPTPPTGSSSVLYEHYNDNTDDANVSVYGVNWASQTFLTANAHTITFVALKLLRVGSPSTITVSIRSTIGGHPTGDVLTSGTLDGDTLTTNAAGAWYNVTLSSSIDVISATTYAIVVGATGGDSSNYVVWKVNNAGQY